MTNGRDRGTYKRRVRDAVERRLANIFSRYPDTEVSRVAKYAVMGGGHRWRAMVAIAAGRIFHPNAFAMVLPGACGIELAHAASLVLDDLPSMDDAELRRGKPCAHHVFPKWAVDMAPIFLVTLAYEVCLDNPAVSHDRRVAAALELSREGLNMIAGQESDLTRSACGDEASLLEGYAQKSGALFAAAAAGGAILCGAGEAETNLLRDCGLAIGLAYQFHDDLADATAGAEQLGKNGRMDVDKETAIDLFGVEGTEERIRRFKREALSKLAEFDSVADYLRTLVGSEDLGVYLGASGCLAP